MYIKPVPFVRQTWIQKSTECTWRRTRGRCTWLSEIVLWRLRTFWYLSYLVHINAPRNQKLHRFSVVISFMFKNDCKQWTKRNQYYNTHTIRNPSMTASTQSSASLVHDKFHWWPLDRQPPSILIHGYVQTGMHSTPKIQNTQTVLIRGTVPHWQHMFHRNPQQIGKLWRCYQCFKVTQSAWRKYLKSQHMW